MKVTFKIIGPNRNDILKEIDSNDLLFGYKLANKPKKHGHMILIFKKEWNGMLPTANGIHIFYLNGVPEIHPLFTVNSLLLSGKLLTEAKAKVQKDEIVQTKGWNNQKINIYDPESAEVQKFMCEVFGIKYTREMKLRQLNKIYEAE